MRLSRQRHFGMPSKEKILSYWSREYEIYSKECFACGRLANLDRCHIIPSVDGGNNSVKNLHLLCAGCHAESEGLRQYFTWFEYKRRHEFLSPIDHIYKLFKKCGININKISKRLAPLYADLSYKDYELRQGELIKRINNYVFYKSSGC